MKIEIDENFLNSKIRQTLYNSLSIISFTTKLPTSLPNIKALQNNPFVRDAFHIEFFDLINELITNFVQIYFGLVSIVKSIICHSIL